MRTGHEGVNRIAKVAEVAKIVRAAWLAGVTLLPIGGAALHAEPRSSAAVAMPADASALLQTAQRQFNAGNYSAAITTLQSAVTQNPSSGEAYYWLGRTYYEIRDYDNAIAAVCMGGSLEEIGRAHV